MKRKPTALKFTDAEIDGTSLKEHTKGEKPKEPQAPDPSKKAHRRKKRAAVNHSKQAKGRNASRFCSRSPALGKEDSLGCSADKARRAYLRFEEERAKKPSKLNHAVKGLPKDIALSTVRSNLHEDSEDNVGIESVDTAIGAAQAVSRLSHDSKRTKEFKDNRSSEYSGERKGSSGKNPDAYSDNRSSSSHSRQKASIKKDYAKKAKDNADNAKSASETASKTASRVRNGVRRIAEYLKSHKEVLGIIAVVALLAVLMLGLMSSCSILFQSGTSGLGMSTYPSKDEDMLSAEESYKSLEEALNQEIEDYELTHAYDEYIYNLGEIGHDPHVLISALTAIYGGEWTAADVSELIQTIFEAQYILTENVVTETRYYTDYTTEWQWTWDNYYQQWVQVPVTVEVQVPYDYYICTVTLESKNLEEVITEMMTDDQKAVYLIYTEMKGNRPDLFE